MLCWPSWNPVSYTHLDVYKRQGLDVVRDYPPIRVWGTVGFIAALWTTSLLKLETSPGQFYIASAASLVLGLYAFTLPPCPPTLGKSGGKPSLVDVLGLSSFRLFKDRTMAVFFVFAMLLGAALRLSLIHLLLKLSFATTYALYAG